MHDVQFGVKHVFLTPYFWRDLGWDHLHDVVPNALRFVGKLPTPLARTFERTIFRRVGCNAAPVKAATTNLGHTVVTRKGGRGLKGVASVERSDD